MLLAAAKLKLLLWFQKKKLQRPLAAFVPVAGCRLPQSEDSKMLLIVMRLKTDLKDIGHPGLHERFSPLE